jgi:hypothetical protein
LEGVVTRGCVEIGTAPIAGGKETRRFRDGQSVEARVSPEDVCIIARMQT